MMRKVILSPARCALDLGDGSERGLYVNQDYILQKLGKIHRGISLMYTYYPNDKEWPTRACNIKSPEETKGAWDTPYENYFPYRGGKEGLRNQEPFNFMKEIRQHGQDVVLTMTIDTTLTEEDIIEVAKDLRPFGRIFLRVNHECTGNWFCYTRRAKDYQQIADFFVMVCNVMHKYAPNVKMILCAGMWQKDTGKLEMEDIFLEAHKAADIWSGDNYLSLHWGWPNDIATKENINISHASYDVKEIYQKCKNTYLRLKEITGQDKPMVLSELNADGDVNGPYVQAKMMKKFMHLIQKDKDNWLSAFTLYQFRDDGRLGLEITNPNNSEVGIEQPILKTYRKELFKPFFSPKTYLISDENITLPTTLKWHNSEQAEGLELEFKVKKNPVFAEIYFENSLQNLNLMIELDGWWFYKKPGIKCIDIMSYFFENKIRLPKTLKLHFFTPPKDGLNYPDDDSDPFQAPNGSWMDIVSTEFPSEPRLRIQYKGVEKM